MMRSFVALLFFGTLTNSSTMGGVHAPERVPTWQAGEHYEVIADAPPRKTSPHAIEVTEWFWIGCPHCFAIEPYVLKWNKTLGDDVRFTRVAVAWHQPERVAHAKLYYSLRELGRLDLLPVVFDTIHRRGNRLYVAGDEVGTQKRLTEFAEAQHLNTEAFSALYKSPSADAYVTNSNNMALEAHIRGVPSFSIEGQYVTDVARAGSPENLISVVNYLVERERAYQSRTATTK